MSNYIDIGTIIKSIFCVVLFSWTFNSMIINFINKKYFSSGISLLCLLLQIKIEIKLIIDFLNK